MLLAFSIINFHFETEHQEVVQGGLEITSSPGYLEPRILLPLPLRCGGLQAGTSRPGYGRVLKLKGSRENFQVPTLVYLLARPSLESVLTLHGWLGLHFSGVRVAALESCGVSAAATSRSEMLPEHGDLGCHSDSLPSHIR